jgi:GNAT superfamily N-acetyltransferase
MQHCEWWRSGDTIVLLFNGLTPRLLAAYGGAGDLVHMLARLEEPRVWANIRPDFEAAFHQFYQPVRVVRMRRMYMEGQVKGSGGTVRLGPADRPHIEELLQHGEWVLFVPQALASGHFYGIRDAEGTLVAIAGTHLATPRYNMAALGTVFTHPHHRGRGLATICCRDVLASLGRANITRMVLNVEEDKAGACRMYQRLGFRTACTYLDGECARIA